ncbi:MAG: FADH(2)-oxidizing methylenetetrahydrofolate--tRNA-(uracil(54)-C(5))-methyltransferase TrmFO, partial [Mesorhizobium sp.]
MTNEVNLHLLPRVDHRNGARRTSSPGGCCCFWRQFLAVAARQLQSGRQAIIPALMSKN